tara:strand:- start:7697 stop:7894 length:198 start_codon:yes stop_codon:yes gene_type:complete
MGFGSKSSAPAPAPPPPIEKKVEKPDPVAAVDDKKIRNDRTRARARSSSTLLGSEDADQQLMGKG